MKYNLAIVDNPDCNCINDETKTCDKEKFPNRQIFSIDCIPLINLKDGNKNILDWRRDNGYIYFNPNNEENYNLDTNFNLTRYDGKITLSPPSVELLNSLYSKLNYDIVISTSSSALESSSALASSSSASIKIPVYYLYCNKNNEIFNIFITQCIIIYGDFKIFGDLFRINTNDNTFITLSYKFNIFNISLLCGKFFDIIPLFFEEYEEGEIIRRLNEIFSDFNFVNLYTTINGYKYMLKNISTDEIHNGFLNLLPKKTTDQFTKRNSNKKYEDYRKLNNIENNSNTNENSQDKIIGDLARSIFLIRNVLNEINRLIPNFDKLFLMSILSYRLKEGLINATWPFNIDSIRIYITINSEKTKLDNQKLKSIYLMNKPIIYEYTQVTYKEETYGNCMENTILQLLKIFFCNPNTEKFDEKIIRTIIKDEHVQFILDIFKRIDLEEKTTKFDLDWVRFITELSDQYPQFGIYDFIKRDKEINPTLANLILSLKCLTKIEYKTEDTPTTFLNSIIQVINSDYSTSIKSETSKDIVSINCYNNYRMILTHNIHAMFESAKTDKRGLLNILEKITESDQSLKLYLENNSDLTYSDMTNYIYLCSLVYIDIDLFNKYIALLTREKKQNYFNMIFSDSVISKISTVIFDSIFINDVDIIYFENFQYWRIIFMNIKSEKFWEYIISNNLYIKWTTRLLNLAISNIKSEKFWEDYINKNIHDEWSEDIWTTAITSLESDIFWEKMCERDVYNIKWSEELRLLAIQNIKSEKFWEYIIINNIWDTWNTWDNKWWYILFQYVRLEIVWRNIIDNQKIYEKFIDNEKIDYTFWGFVMKNINSVYFWEKIIEKKIYIKWDDRLWLDAIALILYPQLWIIVIDDIEISSKWTYLIWNYSTTLQKPQYFWMQSLKYKYYKKWNINTWNQIIHLIDFPEFFEYIIDNNLCQFWSLELWETAIDNKNLSNYEYFWIQVINKKFYSIWTQQIWLLLIQKIQIDNILIYIIEQELYKLWIGQYYIRDIWIFIIQKIKKESFWEDFLEKDIYTSWNINIWKQAIKNIKSEKFWEDFLRKDIYKEINNVDIWKDIIMYINSELFWLEVSKKKIYLNWEHYLWHAATFFLEHPSFWKSIDIKDIKDIQSKQEIDNKILKYKYNNKYIKYKMKYLQLKKLL